MDYGRVLGRAWQITWRWKVLWILGFLASLTSGSGIGGNSNYRFNDQASGARGFHIPPEYAALVVGLVCLAFIVGIILWVISVMARGGLIAGVAQVEETGSTTFSAAWRAGARRFGTLFGISLVTALPIIILVVLGIVVGIVVLGGTAALTGNSGRDIAAMIVPLLACGIPLFCGALLLGLVLAQIRIYAERAAILENLNWSGAISRGWQMLRSNLGPTLILWLIFLVLGLAFAAVIIAGVLALIAPLFAFGAFGGFDRSSPWLLLPLCCGGLIGIVVAAVLGSIVETFSSATWTLAYRQLTTSAAAPAPGAEG